MKKVLILTAVLLLIGVSVYAADGDLVVNGNLTVSGTVNGSKISSTPAANTVPISDANGKLNGWINNGPTTQDNATGKRSYGVVYQNTTGKVMYISVGNSNSGGCFVALTAYCDASSSPSAVVANLGLTASGPNFSGGLFFIVLPGYHYKVVSGGQCPNNLWYWVEWY
jgi:hypothetical protein